MKNFMTFSFAAIVAATTILNLAFTMAPAAMTHLLHSLIAA